MNISYRNRILGHLPLHVIDKYLSSNANLERSLFIAGTMRSGTTLLQESLEKILRLRLVFEPFAYRAKVFNRYHNGYKYNTTIPITEYAPFIAEGKVDNGFIYLLEASLRGRFSNSWIRRDRSYYFAHDTIVKSVRANLILDYIQRNYIKNIIIILRNPVDVWKSLQYMDDTRNVVSHPEYLNMFNKNGLVKEYVELERLMKLPVKTEYRDFQIFLKSWVIQNYVPLRKKNIDSDFNPYVLTYADLISDPFQIINDILSFTNNSEVSKDFIDKIITHRSSTTVKKKKIGEKVVDEENLNNITFEELKDFQILLDYIY